MALSKLATLTCVAACGTDTFVIAPVLDSPTDTDSSAFPDLDAVTLTVAHAGDVDNLVSQTFVRGQAIELSGVQFADDLVVHMSGRIGSSEVAYGRTCSFASDPGGPPPAPHLFFSRIVKFAQLEQPAVQRMNGRAITYHDGSALFVGGEVDGTPQIDVERFDPRLGRLEVVAQIEGRTLFAEAALGAEEFRIALVGGSADGQTPANLVELLELDSQRPVDSFPDTKMGRIDLTATALTDGRVIVIGGRAPGSPATSGAIVMLEIVNGTPESRTLRAGLATPRAGHTATRLGDDVGAPVLIAGGLDTTGHAVAELFKPLNEDLASPATFHPTMVVPRTGHHATLMPDGSVLILGGLDGANQPVTTLERFTIDAGFTEVTNRLPADAGVIDQTATTLPDGRILLVGGRSSMLGPPLDTAFIARLDPLDGTVDVVQTDRLAMPRAGHQATVLCDGTIIVAGGTTNSNLVERYNPPALGRR